MGYYGFLDKYSFELDLVIMSFIDYKGLVDSENRIENVNLFIYIHIEKHVKHVKHVKGHMSEVKQRNLWLNNA